MFCKEVILWKNLRHPNVLPLLGVMLNDHHFAMVSEWMDNGNIDEFAKTNGDVNRFELVGNSSYCLLHPSLMMKLFPTAWRHCPGINIHAW